ncbi:adhesion G protein-coupled receptor L1-like, partial [Saccoglossus kowalevskii]|uniref:Latrophilin-1-like n=1 Tax=Saccoglossus kowalevskii TaxID=10224 RepID=A0ABM0M9F7_SACKO
MPTTTTVKPTKQKPVTTPTQPHRISLPTLPSPLIIQTTQQPEETTDSKVKTTTVEVKVTTDRRRLYCPAVKVRDIDWPETLTGSGNVIKQCPSGTTGEASWDCNGSPAEWTPASGPDLSACKSPWVNFITGRVDDIEDPDDIIQISEMLVTGTEPDKKLYGGDVKGCIDVIDQLPIALEEQLKDLNQVERQELVSNTADGNLITGSNLLSNEHNDAWLDLSPKEQTQEAAKLLNGMETNGFLVARELPEGQVKTKVTDNIVMEVAVSKTSNLPDDGSVIFPGTKGIVNSSDSIVLSDVSIKARSTNGSAKLVFLMYNNIGHFLEGIDGVGNDTNSSVKLINSRVISASLNTMHSQSLVEPVIITLEHIKNDRRNPVCSYWNASGGSGSWSNSGCETVESNETHTICSCNHLTNFAVLMDVHGTLLPFSHHFALSVITYAGFMISIICLILCLMTFCGFKNLQCDRNTIHKNLCFCLLVAEVLFMAGIDKTEKLINLIFLIMAGVIMCRHTVSPANRNNDKINKL